MYILLIEPPHPIVAFRFTCTVSNNKGFLNANKVKILISAP